MNAEEYKQQINNNDVLDYTTFNVTLKELASTQDFELAAKVRAILDKNQIPKPSLHSDLSGLSTAYYNVDLSRDDIDKIIEVFFQLEADYVSDEGDTTPTALFYASLVDKWNKLTCI